MAASARRKCLIHVFTPLYGKRFQRELRSQRAYARRHGYVLRPEPLAAEEPGRAKWRKVASMRNALARFDAVLLLDADCWVAPEAPDICSQIRTGKCLYMARGPSGRFNSGVILALRSAVSREFFGEALAVRKKALRPEHQVSPEGENGHIIMLAQRPKYREHIAILPRRWNNNTYPYRGGYIKHYSGRRRKPFLARPSGAGGRS